MDQKTKTLVKVVFIFPIPVLLLIPGSILYFTQDIHFGFGLPTLFSTAVLIFALVLIGISFHFVLQTVSLFFNEGNGTPAPWAPPKRFVVAGPYAYVRNPMITAVIGALVGETLVFGSLGILLWTAIFWLIMHLFVVLIEEPGLEKRFGQDYLRYKQNVRRWTPHFKPYQPA